MQHFTRHHSGVLPPSPALPGLFVPGTLLRSCLLLCLMLACGGCSAPPVDRNNGNHADTCNRPVAVEVPLHLIPLSGPVAEAETEISGMAWFGDHLILVPENLGLELTLTGDLAPGSQRVYAIPRDTLRAWLETPAGPIEPQPIPVYPENLPARIPHFDGFEGMAMAADQAFFTIEAYPDDDGHTAAYLVSAQFSEDLSRLDFDLDNITRIVSQTDIPNISEEALLVVDDQIITLHEINSAILNPTPVAHRFDLAMQPTGIFTMPQIEYRITDATQVDDDNRFWAVNYLFPGSHYSEEFERPDVLCFAHGQGPTHARYQQVERLVELEIDGNEIRLTDKPPIQLELSGDWEDGLSRNWEGLVRFDDSGFLIVTDRHPSTVLAFVPFLAPPTDAPPKPR